jgi:hypothetical protein
LQNCCVDEFHEADLELEEEDTLSLDPQESDPQVVRLEL